jgi:hypothetical protein
MDTWSNLPSDPLTAGPFVSLPRTQSATHLTIILHASPEWYVQLILDVTILTTTVYRPSTLRQKNLNTNAHNQTWFWANSISHRHTTRLLSSLQFSLFKILANIISAFLVLATRATRSAHSSPTDVNTLTILCALNRLNHLTPNGHFSGRTAPLTYRCCIFYLFNKYTYWIF